MANELTVLMPVGRIDQYLVEAMDSVLCQENAHFEVFLLLDGVDAAGLPENCRDPRVRILPSISRLGVAMTLNRGLSLSRAPYVARMDADDVCLPDRFARQLEFMRMYPRVGVLGSSVRVVDKNGESIGYRRPIAKSEVVKRRLLVRNQLVHPSTMMRRMSILSVGGYDSRLTRVEDYELWLRMALVTDISNLPHVLLNYRSHGMQWTKARLDDRLDSRLLLYSKRELARSLGYPRATADTVHHVVHAGKLARNRLGLKP